MEQPRSFAAAETYFTVRSLSKCNVIKYTFNNAENSFDTDKVLIIS